MNKLTKLLVSMTVGLLLSSISVVAFAVTKSATLTIINKTSKVINFRMILVGDLLLGGKITYTWNDGLNNYQFFANNYPEECQPPHRDKQCIDSSGVFRMDIAPNGISSLRYDWENNSPTIDTLFTPMNLTINNVDYYEDSDAMGYIVGGDLKVDLYDDYFKRTYTLEGRQVIQIEDYHKPN